MKCPNPQCDNAALDDSHAFCFKCGSKLEKKARFDDAGKNVSSDDENPTPNQDLSTDSGELADDGQRKRKGEQHEEKPAKRKSLEIDEGKDDGNSPLDAELADDATSALQNLALKSKLQDQQEPLPGKTPDDGRHSNETIMSGNSQDSSTDTVHADKATGDEKLKNGTESENLSETNQACEIMETENNCDSTCSQSQMQEICRSSSQTVEDHSNLDEDTDQEEKDESDEELEEDVPVDENGENKRTDHKRNESKSQKDRRKKKERKKKKEAAAKATVKEGNKSSDVQSQDQGQDTSDTREGFSKTTVKDGKGGKKPAKETNKADQEQKKTKEQNSQGYFANDNRERMTVVFHAVLAPHFKYEKTKGDKVVMRFGGTVFRDFLKDITEMQCERSLHDNFLLFNGMLQVPVVLVRDRVYYKYAVVRKARERKEKDMFLWEHVDNAPYKNRCLSVPKGRCQAGTTWHQYDDAIFGGQTLFQSLRNMMPFWKNTDAAEGRTIATLAMLPRWEGFLVGKDHRDMTSWEAVEEVKDVAYCMTKSYEHDNQGVRLRVPRGYVFDRVLKDYLAPKIKENASLQEGGGKKILPLVSSVAIAHVLWEHKVNLDEDDYRNLFQSLILWSEPNEKTCTAFEELIKHFPGKHLRTLGESIQALCREVVKQYRGLYEWLSAIPLVHFLTQQSEPFNDSSLLMEMPKGKDDTWWGSEGFQTRTVRDRTFLEKRGPCSVMNKLHPLFDLDPLFRRTFLLVVPCREFGNVVTSGEFPPVKNSCFR